MWFLFPRRNSFFLHSRLFSQSTWNSQIPYPYPALSGSSVCPLPTTPCSSLLSRHLAPFHHSPPAPHRSSLYSGSCPVAARIGAVEDTLKIPERQAYWSQPLRQVPQSLHHPEAAAAGLLVPVSQLGQHMCLLQIRFPGKTGTKLWQVFMECMLTELPQQFITFSKLVYCQETRKFLTWGHYPAKYQLPSLKQEGSREHFLIWTKNIFSIIPVLRNLSC